MITHVDRALFYQDSIDKQWIISGDGINITNSDIGDGEITLNEHLCSSENLQFGACESSSIEFTVYGLNTALKRKQLSVSLILNHDIANPLQIGTFYVESDKPEANRKSRKIVAYDKLKDINESQVNSWYSNLTFPITFKNLRDSFFNHFNVEQETVSLPNDNITISVKPTFDGDIYGSDIIQPICEANGCFGHMGRDNKFHYITLSEWIPGLYPANDLYPSDDLYPREERVSTGIEKENYISIKYEDYEVQKIDKLIINNAEGEPIETIGTGTNTYHLTNIFSCELLGQTRVDFGNALYDVISRITYNSCEITAMGNPCIEVGDTIRINTNEKIFYTYIIDRSMSGTSRLIDSYSCSGTERRGNNYAGINGRISGLEETQESQGNELEEHEDRIDAIEVENLRITGRLEAAEANIDTLEAADVTITGRLTAAEANIDSLEATSATITQLEAATARISTLEADDVTINNKLTAAEADIDTLQANEVTISGRITAAEGNISSLQASDVTISGNLSALQASFDSLTAEHGRISNLEVDNITIHGSITAQGETISAQGQTISTQGSAINTNSNNISSLFNTTGTMQNTIDAHGQSISNLNTVVARKIDADDITASFISGKFPAANNGLTISTETLRSAHFYWYTAVGPYGLAYHTMGGIPVKDTSGNTRYVLGILS